MAVAEENEKEEKAEEAPKKKGKGKLIIIIVAVVLLAAIGGGAALFLGGGQKPAEGGEGEEQHKEVAYQTARLDTFIVNLSESSAFIKVTLLIEYDPSVFVRAAGHGKGGGHASGEGGSGGEKAEGGLPPQMKEREPMIKDAIIRILSSKTTQEVLTVEGKEKLKEELIEGINEAIGLEEGPVVNVYFIEFIIQ